MKTRIFGWFPGKNSRSEAKKVTLLNMSGNFVSASKKCNSGYYFCRDKGLKQCLPRFLMCDGRKDCSDGSDESLCGNSRFSITLCQPQDTLYISSPAVGVIVFLQFSRMRWRLLQEQCKVSHQCSELFFVYMRRQIHRKQMQFHNVGLPREQQNRIQHC